MSPLLVALLLMCSGTAFADAQRDGFNLFKDRLRGKGEEEVVEEPEPLDTAPRVLYFYRTPVARQSGDLFGISPPKFERALHGKLVIATLNNAEPHPLAAEFGKRINQFRDLLMQREMDSSASTTGGDALGRRRRRRREGSDNVRIH